MKSFFSLVHKPTLALAQPRIGSPGRPSIP